MKLKTVLLAAALGAVTLLARAEPAAYAIDPSHTTVVWEALHSGTSTLRGRFAVKEGTVTFDRAGKTGKADITIDTNTLSVPPANFERHVKSPELLNVAAFPTARFVSDSFTFDGDKVTAVPGQLTLLGKTLPVTLQAVRFNCYQHGMLKREVCGGDFETTLPRSQFGITYGPQAAADGVKLLIQIEAIKQQ